MIFVIQYASLTIAQGENIKYIQTRLGHVKASITLDVYAHLMSSTNQEAACRLEDAVFGFQNFKIGSKMVVKQLVRISLKHGEPHGA